MTEETQMEATAQDSSQHLLDPGRSRTMRRSYLIAIIFLAVTLLDSMSQYTEFGAWQILADAGGILLGFILLVVSYLFFTRGRVSRAVSLIPFVIFAGYAPGDLFLEGVTLYNLISGMLLFALTYFIFRPESAGSWFRTAVLYIIAVFVFSQVNVFPRFDISVSQSWVVSLPIFTIVVSGLLLWQMLANLQIRTIRTRLLLIFMGIGLIPALIIALSSTFISYQRDQAQAENNLNSISTIKTDQIEGWYQQLDSDLSNLQQTELFRQNAQFLLSYTPTESSLATIKNDIYNSMNPFAGPGTNFSEILIVDVSGQVVLSSRPQNEDLSYASDQVFINALSASFGTTITLNEEGNQIEVSVAQPIIGDDQDVIGVLFGKSFTNDLTSQVLGNIQLIQGGNSYLISLDRTLLTPLGGEQPLNVGDQLQTNFVLDEASTQTAGIFQTYDNFADIQVLGVIRYIPTIDSYLVVEQSQAAAFRTLRLNLITNASIAVLTLFAIIFVSIYSARTISQPIVELSQDAEKVWQREINYIDPIDRQDEIGQLSGTLSKMTGEIFQTTANLEDVVSERTHMLERRAAYLQTTSEISKALTGIYNLENLLNTVTFLINENFGFYHVGIFLLDDQKEYAELKAANSEGGWRMLARQHKLKVGEQGIVGFVTGSGLPRVQQQVAGEDSVYYNNPDLPLTKSELALPLKAGNQIFGALDVQSIEEEAFSEEDVSALQVLADAVAVAIQNTRLVQQLQESLETERKIYGEITSTTWQSMLERSATIPAFKSNQYGVQPVGDSQSPLAQKAMQTGQIAVADAEDDSGMHHLAVPIRVRGGAVVAVIETQKSAEFSPWTNEEITILESVGTEMGMAIENARLFEEIQRTAQRERISANLSSKIWASTDVENILQTAVRELGSALNISFGTIKLKLPDETESNGNQDGVEL